MPFKKGHQGYKPVGRKNNATLKVEELRKQFEAKFAANWELLMQKTLEDALKNWKHREYAINQVIGKPKEVVELEGGDNPVQIDIAIKETIKKVYGNKD